MAASIPLHRPVLGGLEEQALLRALRAEHLAGNGPECRALEAKAALRLGVSGVLAVNSCTSALEIALQVLGLGPGDEVLLPSFTFVSAASAILRTGATPVFCDIDPLTANVTADLLAARRTEATRAILLVHYAGLACDMDPILAFARHHGLKVIEDAAHAFGATYHGRPLGTLGDAGCFSLHASKNITCGEGGLLVMADAALAEQARILREKGTDRQAFAEGRSTQYAWLELGSSYTLSDLLAALAVAQLEQLDVFWAARRKVARAYAERLHHATIQLPPNPGHAQSSWHLYPVQVPADQRSFIIQHLARHGIEAAPHYPPLHLAPYALQHLPARVRGVLPATVAVSSRLLRLPIHPHLTSADVDQVCHRLLEALSMVVPRMQSDEPSQGLHPG